MKSAVHDATGITKRNAGLEEEGREEVGCEDAPHLKIYEDAQDCGTSQKNINKIEYVSQGKNHNFP